MMDRSRFVASDPHVNPLDIKIIEPMGAMERIAQAMPIDPDPLWPHGPGRRLFRPPEPIAGPCPYPGGSVVRP